MKWLDKLQEYAPHIAGAILSGGATLPALATKAIGDIIGKDIKGDDELADIITSASPETMLKIRQADNAFKIRMRELDQELDASELRDMQHARDTHKDSNIPTIICLILTVGLMAFVALLMFESIPERNERMIDTIFGSYLMAWLSSLAYFTGTSRGSSIKNAILMRNESRGKNASSK